MLQHKAMHGVSLRELEAICNSDRKGRYELDSDSSCIRAVQGHSNDYVSDSLLLQPFRERDAIVCHGTFKIHWEHIREIGLSPMVRNHIHWHLCRHGFEEPLQGGTNVRPDSDLLIYCVVGDLLDQGISVQIAKNNVVLTGPVAAISFVGVIDKDDPDRQLVVPPPFTFVVSELVEVKYSRDRQLALSHSTLEYHIWATASDELRDRCRTKPHEPDPSPQAMSKRQFNRAYSQWRRDLHLVVEEMDSILLPTVLSDSEPEAQIPKKMPRRRRWER
jgi:RNA:NAD 2'-phosphotransferase (TPT1/KptA family)